MIWKSKCSTKQDKFNKKSLKSVAISDLRYLCKKNITI